MKVAELAALLNAEMVVYADRDIVCGCCCDLLSQVIAGGKEGMAWVTVQTHMNVVAVAVMHNAACVIAAGGRRFEEDVVEKACEEGVALLCSEKTPYALCAEMARAGIEG